MDMNSLPVSLLAAGFGPGDVTAGPLFLTLLGIIAVGGGIMWFGAVKQPDHKLPWLKFLAVPIFACAAYWGYGFFAYAQESLQLKLQLVGGSSLTAYRAIFFVPLLLAIGALAFGIYWDKFRRDDEVF